MIVTCERPPWRARLSPVPRSTSTCMSRRPGGLRDGVAQLAPVARGGDQHPEDQPAAEHDLLDVEHLDPGARPGSRRSTEVTPGRSLPVSVISRVPGWRGLLRHRPEAIGAAARSRTSARRPDLGRAGGHQGAPPGPLQRHQRAAPPAISCALTAPPSSSSARSAIASACSPRAASSTQRAGTPGGASTGSRWRRFISRSATSGRQRATSRRGQGVGRLDQRGAQRPVRLAHVGQLAALARGGRSR